MVGQLLRWPSTHCLEGVSVSDQSSEGRLIGTVWFSELSRSDEVFSR